MSAREMQAIVGQAVDEVLEELRLATAIADGAARSDIECYAAGRWIGEVCWYDLYDLDKAEASGRSTQEENTEALTVVRRAARYIELRDFELPYRMVRHPELPNLVCFEGRSEDRP